VIKTRSGECKKSETLQNVFQLLLSNAWKQWHFLNLGSNHLMRKPWKVRFKARVHLHHLMSWVELSYLKRKRNDQMVYFDTKIKHSISRNRDINKHQSNADCKQPFGNFCGIGRNNKTALRGWK
jgi:hypothetical protein